jgi:hypothetical protein
VAAKHKRPEPLLTRAKVTAAINALGTLAITLGVLTPALEDRVAGLLIVAVNVGAPVVAAVGPIVTAYVSRGKVTPTEDPRSVTGEKLKPETQVPDVSAVVLVALEKAAAVLATDGEPEAEPAAA